MYLPEKVKVIDARGKSEVNAVFLVKNENYENYTECFVHGDSDIKYFKENVGKEVLVNFIHVTYKSSIVKTKVKNVTYIKKTPVAVNMYNITGEIVDITKNPEYEDSYTAIVDCGFKVTARILKKNNPKVGDYVKLEGRLDAKVSV